MSFSYTEGGVADVSVVYCEGAWSVCLLLPEVEG